MALTYQKERISVRSRFRENQPCEKQVNTTVAFLDLLYYNHSLEKYRIATSDQIFSCFKTHTLIKFKKERENASSLLNYTIAS